MVVSSRRLRPSSASKVFLKSFLRCKYRRRKNATNEVRTTGYRQYCWFPSFTGKVNKGRRSRYSTRTTKKLIENCGGKSNHFIHPEKSRCPMTGIPALLLTSAYFGSVLMIFRKMKERREEYERSRGLVPVPHSYSIFDLRFVTVLTDVAICSRPKGVEDSSTSRLFLTFTCI